MKRNSHPYDPVPENVRQAIETIHNFIYLNGWGGKRGDEFWAYQGIGNVHPLLNKIEQQKKSRLGYRKHIRMLQKQITKMKIAMMGAKCCTSCDDPIKMLNELILEWWRLDGLIRKNGCSVCEEIISFQKEGTLSFTPFEKGLSDKMAKLLEKHKQITNQQNNKQ